MITIRLNKLSSVTTALCLCICLTSVNVAATRSREKENRRRNERILSSTASNQYNTYNSVPSSVASSAHSFSSSLAYKGPVDDTGLCVRRRDMKLMCYCTPDENHVPVQKAECWVFSTGLLENDTTWTRFYQQPRIRDLKFVVQNHGRLDYIPTHILQPLQNLTSISIEYSQVDVVRPQAFANLHQLERIVMTNNHISALDSEAFANHIRLRDLNLENNHIFEIDRKAFRNLPLCERLNLNNNNISSLHEGMFSDLVRLIYLNLAENQISVLTTGIFKGLGNLNVLKLTHNNINFIGDAVFTELWSLTELELDDNKIERISERALDGLNNLKTLNLRNNLLKKIDNGLLRGTPALLSLNVEDNKLETLTFYTFQPIMDNLVNASSELLVNKNEFICDCRLQWLFELKNRTRQPQLRDSLESFVCSLQDPHLHNFIEPVPQHILELLNVGGISAGASSSDQFISRKHHTKTRQGGQRRNNKFEGQIQLTDDRHEQTLENAVLLKKKRALLPYQNLANVEINESNKNNKNASQKPVESHYVFGDGSSGLNSDYFDASSKVLLTNSVKLEDELELMKQNALYSQNNDILTSQQTQNYLIATNSQPVQPLPILVRLFLLKPERLPCHEELSDPTELPLSRDLMDARSSNVQVLSATNNASISIHSFHILWLILAIVYGTQVG